MCDRGNRYNRKEKLHPEKIDLPKDIWTNPEYADPRMKVNFLLFRKLTPKKREELSKCTDKIIDYMRKVLNLDKWECYYLVGILKDSFPIEELIS